MFIHLDRLLLVYATVMNFFVMLIVFVFNELFKTHSNAKHSLNRILNRPLYFL